MTFVLAQECWRDARWVSAVACRRHANGIRRGCAIYDLRRFRSGGETRELTSRDVLRANRSH